MTVQRQVGLVGWAGEVQARLADQIISSAELKANGQVRQYGVMTDGKQRYVKSDVARVVVGTAVRMYA